MTTRVFSQEPDLVAALPKLLAHARRFFAMELNVLSASTPDRQPSESTGITLRLESARHGGSGTFVIDSRPTTEQDRTAAERAEERGKAGGMAALAARCQTLWEVTAREALGTAELEISALLASVALGPILPADESTLYGVRGAMERAEKASATS